MDQPGLDARRHKQALAGLARVNRISGAATTIWKTMRHAVRAQTHRPLRVLDVACGGGDVAISLWKRARRSRVQVQVTGCDVSPTAVNYARSRADAIGAEVTFLECDVLADGVPDGFDVVCCSLFVHHLHEDEVVVLFRSMRESAGQLVLVSDLARSRWGYVLAWCGVRLLTRSRICHVDGPLSVRAAFTPSEALSLATQAGFDGVRLTRHWPQRYLLAWSRT